MKKITILLTFLFVSVITFSQVGISVGHKSMKADTWFTALNNNQNTNVSSVSGLNFGVDYWFRLKNYRVEFFPEISFEKYDQDFLEINLSLQSFNFYFNTNIYFLDIEGDCNCPTFSKDGNFLTKGLFLQISPGWTFWKNSSELTAFGTEITKNTNNIGLGVGVGIDFGVSDFLTVTPIFKYYFLPSVENETVEPIINIENNESDVSQIYLGLRIGVRWRQ